MHLWLQHSLSHSRAHLLYHSSELPRELSFSAENKSCCISSVTMNICSCRIQPGCQAYHSHAVLLDALWCHMLCA